MRGTGRLLCLSESGGVLGDSRTKRNGFFKLSHRVVVHRSCEISLAKVVADLRGAAIETDRVSKPLDRAIVGFRGSENSAGHHIRVDAEWIESESPRDLRLRFIEPVCRQQEIRVSQIGVGFAAIQRDGLPEFRIGLWIVVMRLGQDLG